MPVGGESGGAMIGMPGWLMIAEPEKYRTVEGAVDSPAFELWSEEFHPPGPNELLEAEGWQAVVADYEWMRSRS